MRYLLTCTVFIIFNQAIHCQPEDNTLTDIARRFRTYCREIPREEIFVATDRDIYISGEDVWFNIWLFNRQEETLSGNSKIAYVEILNPFNRPVVQKRIGLDSGTGSGRFILPDTLSPGVYILRAYTNWMKNFMPDNCFTRKLKIYGKSENQDFLKADLPGISDTGQKPANDRVSIRVYREKKDIVQAEIASDAQFRNMNGNALYLFVQTHGIINDSRAINLTGDTTRIKLLVDDLLPGINQFTLFDSDGNPVCETYSYTPRMQSGKAHLAVMAPDSCKSREPVSVILDAGYDALDDTAYLSVSVVPAGLKSQAGIEDYLVFGSEFGVLPDIFMEESLDNIPDSIIDNFLSDAKSNWIDWNLILADEMPEIKYPGEERFHYLTGSTFSGLVNESAMEHLVFLSIPGRDATLQYSGIKADGTFELCLPADNILRDLVIQADVPLGKNKIIVNSSFSDRYPGLKMQRYSDTIRSSLISKLAFNQRVNKIFRSFEPPVARVQELLSSDSKCFYGKPDVELVMSDYIVLPTMQEVFFELIPGVAIRSENRGHRITIRDMSDGRLFENPLLLIDGVLVRDPEVIAGLDPQLVERIHIIRSGYVFGDYLFQGIINVITIQGDIGDIMLPEDVSRFRYRAYEGPIEYACPDYSQAENRNSHIPDFRNTLYWKTITLKNPGKDISISFPASDFLSGYDIVVQGVTQSGRLISESAKIRITK